MLSLFVFLPDFTISLYVYCIPYHGLFGLLGISRRISALEVAALENKKRCDL